METEVLPTSNTQKRLATHAAQLWPENDASNVKRFKGQQLATSPESEKQTEEGARRFKHRLQKQVSTFVALSPITELSKNLHSTSLSTPKASEKSASAGRRLKQFRDLQYEFESDNARESSTLFDDAVEDSGTAEDNKNRTANNLRTFNSLSSTYSTDSNSLDDEYIALFEMESSSGQSNEPAMLKLPSDLDTLISGKLYQDTLMATPAGQDTNMLCDDKTIELRRPKVRRCLSLMDATAEQQLANDSFGSSFKRREPLNLDMKASDDGTPIRKSLQNVKQCDAAGAKTTTGKPNVLRKCISMNDAQIMTALARSEQIGEPELIGDFSKPCALPVLTTGQRHRDLKTISCATLARLMAGEYDDVVSSYHIVDCRYPYEYLGGHIRGASNLFTHDQIISTFPALFKQQRDSSEKSCRSEERHIIIFHCEFSSERGPKLMRFLRNNDRETHTNAYPELDYPELYLLHNGYKEFYETHGELCVPSGYVPMLSPAHNEQYRLFRAKSKSWQGDSGPGGTALRTKKSRSRLSLHCIE